jgi:hypothetical protein
VRCAAACDVRVSGPGKDLPAVSAGSLGHAGTLTLRHVRVPRTLRPSPPVPKPLGVRVRRDGDDLVVRWRTSFGARHVVFFISATRRRGFPL